MLKKLQDFNARLAMHITGAVGSMWCAYAFGILALISLPDAIKGGTATLIAWIAQTFLQLVLLSVIMVGQSVNNDRSEARAKKNYDKSEARAEKDHKMIQEQFTMMHESMAEMKDLHREIHTILILERGEKG